MTDPSRCDADHVGGGAEPPESFDPTAGWQDLLSVLVMLVGGVVAAILLFAIGVWLYARRGRLDEPGADAAESPSTP